MKRILIPVALLLFSAGVYFLFVLPNQIEQKFKDAVPENVEVKYKDRVIRFEHSLDLDQ